jgi:hypothetical protein
MPQALDCGGSSLQGQQSAARRPKISFVILSEAKNPSSISVGRKNPERFFASLRMTTILSFSASCKGLCH